MHDGRVRELTLDDAEHVGRDAPVVRQRRIFARHHLVGEELVHGFEQLARGRSSIGPRVVGLRRRTRRGERGTTGVGRQQLEEVPLLLRHPPADGSEFDRANPAGQVEVGLEHAPDAPTQRLLDEPPVQRVAIDGPPARGLVRGDELVDRPEPADLERFTEAPGLETEPGEILERVADVDEFPVDDRVQAGRSDDDVADAEVAMDECVGGGRRAVGHEPGVRLVEDRAPVGEPAVLAPHGIEGIGRLGVG